MLYIFSGRSILVGQFSSVNSRWSILVGQFLSVQIVSTRQWHQSESLLIRTSRLRTISAFAFLTIFKWNQEHFFNLARLPSTFHLSRLSIQTTILMLLFPFQTRVELRLPHPYCLILFIVHPPVNFQRKCKHPRPIDGLGCPPWSLAHFISFTVPKVCNPGERGR